MISLGKRNKINFLGGQGAGGDGNRIDQVGSGRKEEDSMRKKAWNGGAFKGQCVNPEHWNLPGACEGDPIEDS